jgi:hypothetical protein
MAWHGDSCLLSSHPRLPTQATGRLHVVMTTEDGAEEAVAVIPPCKPLRARTNPVLRPHIDGAGTTDGDDANAAAGKGVADKQDSLRGASTLARRGLQLPPDYDGWLQYAAFHNASGFDVFTALMSVPDAPKAIPDILYLFPGLQNIDWIPKARALS